MLMQDSKNAHIGDNPDPSKGQDYPFVLLVMDASFAACAAINRWFKRWRSRQLLARLDSHQLSDIGLTRSDIRSGRLGEILAAQKKEGVTTGRRAEARPLSLNTANMCRRALTELRDDELVNLSETGLKARREARRAQSRS